MAYGKNAEALKRVGSFRQASGKHMKYANTRGPRGPIPYFLTQYTPSTSHIDSVRLIAGDYLQDQIEGEGKEATAIQVILPFVKFQEHFDGSNKKGAICSAGVFAGDRERRKPCYGCDIFWETAARSSTGRFESNRMSRQNKYAFSVFDYSVYHKIEDVDRESGQVRINPTTQKPYFKWAKCKGQVCDACRAQKESKVGDMRHWPLNYTDFQVIRSAESDIGQSCATCGTENSIISHGWMCAACGEGIVDMMTTELTSEELLAVTDNEYKCKCGHTGFLVELFECPPCTKTGKTGARASLFDVDLKVRVVLTESEKKVLQIMGWSAPHPIDPKFEEAKALDLVAIYAPDPLERQATKFGVVTAPGPRREPQTGDRQPAQSGGGGYQLPYDKK